MKKQAKFEKGDVVLCNDLITFDLFKVEAITKNGILYATNPDYVIGIVVHVSDSSLTLISKGDFK